MDCREGAHAEGVVGLDSRGRPVASAAFALADITRRRSRARAISDLFFSSAHVHAAEGRPGGDPDRDRDAPRAAHRRRPTSSRIPAIVDFSCLAREVTIEACPTATCRRARSRGFFEDHR